MGQVGGTRPREDAPQRGGFAGRGQNLRDLANEEYCTKGRQRRQIVCLIYTFTSLADRIPANPRPQISGGAEHCARSPLSRLPTEAEHSRVDHPPARDKALVELYQGIIAMLVCVSAEFISRDYYQSW